MGKITDAYGKKFDALRKAFGPSGNLTLLSLTGKDSEGVTTYATVAALSTGWQSNAARGTDGSAYTKLEITDASGNLRELVDGTGDTPRTTHFAHTGIVYRIEPDEIKRPVSEPLIWELRGYETQDTYE